jgi:hypothetical protein
MTPASATTPESSFLLGKTNPKRNKRLPASLYTLLPPNYPKLLLYCVLRPSRYKIFGIFKAKAFVQVY